MESISVATKTTGSVQSTRDQIERIYEIKIKLGSDAFVFFSSVKDARVSTTKYDFFAINGSFLLLAC